MLSYELLTNPNPNVVSDTISALANAALGAYCGGFSNYLTLNPAYRLVPGLPGLASELHRAACNRTSPPVPLPAPDWDSRKGQCPVRYNVTIRWRQLRCYAGSCFAVQPPPQETTTFGVMGPIAGLAIQDGFMGILTEGGAGFDPDYFPGAALEWYKIVNIERVDGLPDVCGDSPPSLPTYPPGGVNIPPTTVNFRPPYLPPSAPPIPMPLFPLPIVIIPRINFSPVINLDIGGINFQFDMRGWQFSVPVDIDIPIRIDFSNDEANDPPYRRLPPPPPSPPNTPPPGDAKECDLEPLLKKLQGLEEDLNKVDEKIKELLECPCDSLADLDIFPVATGVTGQAFSLPSDTKAITVSLTGTPTKRNEQSGMGGEDLQYAGWVAFRYSNGYDSMMSIRFNQTVYRCRPGVVGFTITVYDGRKANIQRLQ